MADDRGRNEQRVVRDRNGAALTPDDRYYHYYASRPGMQGGAEALRGPVGKPAGAVVATRRGKAARRTAARKVAAINVYLPPPTAPKGKGKYGKGGMAGANGKNGKGKRRRDDSGQELCFSFNNRAGNCAAGAAGGHCPAGRLHICTGCGDARHALADGWC